MLEELAPLLRDDRQAFATLPFRTGARPMYQFSNTLIVKINAVSDAIAQRIEFAGTPLHDSEALSIGQQQIVLLLSYYLHCDPLLRQNRGDSGSGGFVPENLSLEFAARTSRAYAKLCGSPPLDALPSIMH
jgi:hypothetical protein